MVFQTDLVALAGLELHLLVAIRAFVDVVEVDDRFAIEVELESVHADGAQLIGPGDGRGEITAPAHAEIVVVHICARSAIPPVEVDFRIDAGEERLGGKRNLANHFAGTGIGQFARPMWFAVEVAAVEIFAGEAAAAIGAVGRRQRRRGDHFEIGHIRRQIAAARIDHAGGWKLGLNSRERRDWRRRVEIVGVGADDGDSLERFAERQQVVLILQQHDRFARRFKRELAVRGAIVHAVRDLRVFHHGARIEHAQTETGQQQAAERLIDFGLFDQALAHGGENGFVLHAAVEIGPGLDGFSDAGFGSGRELVMQIDIADGAAIGDHVAAEAPLLAQDLFKQTRVGAGGRAIYAVVGAHHGLGAAVFDGGLELRQVRVAEIALIHHSIEGMALRLGAAVDGVVLGGGNGLEVFGVVAL